MKKHYCTITVDQNGNVLSKEEHDVEEKFEFHPIKALKGFKEEHPKVAKGLVIGGAVAAVAAAVAGGVAISKGKSESDESDDDYEDDDYDEIDEDELDEDADSDEEEEAEDADSDEESEEEN